MPQIERRNSSLSSVFNVGKEDPTRVYQSGNTAYV